MTNTLYAYAKDLCLGKDIQCTAGTWVLVVSVDD